MSESFRSQHVIHTLASLHVFLSELHVADIPTESQPAIKKGN